MLRVGNLRAKWFQLGTSVPKKYVGSEKVRFLHTGVAGERLNQILISFAHRNAHQAFGRIGIALFLPHLFDEMYHFRLDFRPT